jgi:orotate phosphoribosyltransferase
VPVAVAGRPGNRTEEPVRKKSDVNETKRERLIELLRTLSFQRKRVVLASGRESDFFIDCKQTALTAEGHALIGELMFDALSELGGCEAVAGVELGGCPLASAVSLVSFLRERPLPALYVRKARKDHGTAKMIEGDRALRPGLRVALLEDVVTTGGSSLKAVEELRQAGAQVVGIIALVDRLEGGAEAIRGAGVPLVALATRRDFMGD